MFDDVESAIGVMSFGYIIAIFANAAHIFLQNIQISCENHRSTSSVALQVSFISLCHINMQARVSKSALCDFMSLQLYQMRAVSD